MIAIVATVVAVVVHFPRQAVHSAAANSGDWPTYLGNNARTDYNNAETAITATTAQNLKVHWTYSTGGAISTQPVEVNGTVYWGPWDGNEYATDLSGNKIWSTPISTATPDCTSTNIFGAVSTATVADVLINGIPTSVVFVGGKQALYALDAMTGTVIWKTILNSSSGAFIWSSPAVYNGNVYIGVSSVDDCPLVQGALVQVDAITGAIQHTFSVVPNGCLGGSIWSSPTIDEATGTIYVSTGNKGSCKTKEIYAAALVKLSALDLSVIDSWQVPASEQISDGDFGATPTLFTATVASTALNMVVRLTKMELFTPLIGLLFKLVQYGEQK